MLSGPAVWVTDLHPTRYTSFMEDTEEPRPLKGSDDPAAHALLDALALKRLGDLMFVSRRLVEGLYAGRHASPKKGHSTEFYDYRAYVPGDDPKRLDWKLYGRTDRLYVRRFRHDADLTVHLVLDRSASMAFTGLDKAGRLLSDQQQVSKWLYARQLAAAIAYLTIRQGDRVSLSMLGAEGCEALMPSGMGQGHLKQVVRLLEDAKCDAAGSGMSIEENLRVCHARLGSRGARGGVLVLISDFWSEGSEWMKSLHPFLHDRYDVLALGVHTSQELTLEGLGSLRLVDLETRQSVRTYGPGVRQGYKEKVDAHFQSLKRMLQSRGCDFARLRCDQPPLEGLREFMAHRGAVLGAGR